MTTSGFSWVDTWALSRPLMEGRWGKPVCSSRSGRLALTIAGIGTSAKTRTAQTEVKMPLMISSVDRNDTHAYFTRGV